MTSQLVCCQWGNEHRQRKQAQYTFRQQGVAIGGAKLWLEWCPLHEKMVDGGITAIEREARLNLLKEFILASGMQVYGE